MANGTGTGIKHLKCTAVTEMLITTVSIFGEDIVRNSTCVLFVLLIYSLLFYSFTVTSCE